MGTAVASDIIQKKLDSVYMGLPGVTWIADDMVVYGKVSHRTIGTWFNSLRLPEVMD